MTSTLFQLQRSLICAKKIYLGEIFEKYFKPILTVEDDKIIIHDVEEEQKMFNYHDN